MHVSVVKGFDILPIMILQSDIPGATRYAYNALTHFGYTGVIVADLHTLVTIVPVPTVAKASPE